MCQFTAGYAVLHSLVSLLIVSMTCEIDTIITLVLLERKKKHRAISDLPKVTVNEQQREI